MYRGELSVFKAIPLRKELMDNSPPTDIPPFVPQPHSQSVPGSAVKPSQPLDTLDGDRL